MAKKSLAKPAFEPMFTKELAMENLSADACRNRDITRRLVAVIASKTVDEVLEMVSKDPETCAHMASMADELLDHVKAEAKITSSVFARIVWALDKAGHVELPA